MSLTSDFMAPAALQVSASHAPRLLPLDSSLATNRRWAIYSHLTVDTAYLCIGSTQAKQHVLPLSSWIKPLLPAPLPSFSPLFLAQHICVCVLGEVCAGGESRPHMLDKAFITEPPPDHFSVNKQGGEHPAGCHCALAPYFTRGLKT